MDIKLPYVVWREGRPRFVPPGHVRKLGFAGEDLKHATGAWFSLEEAKAWADANLIKINTVRNGGSKPKKSAGVRHSVGELLEDWLNSEHVKGLAKVTSANYRVGADAILYKPHRKKGGAARIARADPNRAREEFSLAPVAAVTVPVLRGFFNHIKKVRSLNMATLCIDCFSAAYTWGVEDLRWNLPAKNPRKEMTFEKAEGRVVVIEPKEFVALVEAADRIGQPSIGDMIYLGFYSGQRQTDRMSFVDDGYEDGRRKFRQSKTGMVVRLREPDELKARIAEARKRRAELMLRHGTRCDEIVLNENTGRPWSNSGYRKAFRKVRKEAAKMVRSCRSKRDQDLRDTCVTLMYRAGADIKSICDVTGHSYKSAELIIKHYLGRDPKRADAALLNMAAFVNKELQESA